MFKLIAFDLDGTLLNDKKEIHPKDIESIYKIIENGIDIIVATGRRYFSAAEILKKYRLPVYLIANNGNIMRNSIDDELVYKNTIPNEKYLNILNLCNNSNIKSVVHVDGFHKGYDILMVDGDKSKYETEYMKGFDGRIKYYNNLKDAKEEDVLGVVLVGRYEELYHCQKTINERYFGHYSTHLLTNLDGNLCILEVLNGNSDKWYLINEYAKNKNIKSKEIIAIGDENNDFKMIKNAGVGIAMINGIENVKRVSDYISEFDNNNRGAILRIRDILKKYNDLIIE